MNLPNFYQNVFAIILLIVIIFIYDYKLKLKAQIEDYEPIESIQIKSENDTGYYKTCSDGCIELLKYPDEYVQSYDRKRIYSDWTIGKVNDLGKIAYPNYFPGGDYWSISIMFPSSIWLAKERLFLSVARVNKIVGWPMLFLVYLTLHDTNWKEVAFSNISLKFGNLTFPTFLPIKFDTDGRFYGPEDSRLFYDHNNDLKLAFNMWTIGTLNRMFIYDFKTRQVTRLRLDGIDYIVRQKNWAPMIINHTTYFIFAFNDFKMIRCNYTTNGECKFLKSFNSAALSEISTVKIATPPIKLNSEFYFSIGWEHTRFGQYRPRVILMHVKNQDVMTAKAIYVSDVLEVNLGYYSQVIIISSIARIDYVNDIMDILMYYEDRECYSYKIRGLLKFIWKRIKIYKISQEIDLGVADIGIKHQSIV